MTNDLRHLRHRASTASDLGKCVGLMMSYSKRGALAAELDKVNGQLARARQDGQLAQGQSIRTVGGTRRADLLEDRLSEDDIRQLISAFLGGTPKSKLAECYGISLSSVKRILRRHGISKQSRSGLSRPMALTVV